MTNKLLTSTLNLDEYAAAMIYMYIKHLTSNGQPILVPRTEVAVDTMRPVHKGKLSINLCHQYFEAAARYSKTPEGLQETKKLLGVDGYIESVMPPTKKYLKNASVAIKAIFEHLPNNTTYYQFVPSGTIVSYNPNYEDQVEQLVDNILSQRGINDPFDMIQNLCENHDYVYGSIAPSVNTAWSARKSYLDSLHSVSSYNHLHCRSVMIGAITDKLAKRKIKHAVGV